MATFACYREEIATFAMLKRRNCNICYVIVRKSQQKYSMLFGWKNVKRIVNTVCYIDTNRQHCLFIHRTGEDFIQNSESKSKGNHNKTSSNTNIFHLRYRTGNGLFSACKWQIPVVFFAGEKK